VPRGRWRTADEAEEIAKELGGRVVVKAQIHAGGRGKGGGVKLAEAAEARAIAQQILGMTLVTHQTGPKAARAALLVEETLPIEKRALPGHRARPRKGKPVFMASPEGGMDIEEVAAKTPS
jgi:succinyl-CoA synthetase beta subunit